MRRARKYRDEALNEAAKELDAYTELRRQIEYYGEKLTRYRERYSSVKTEGNNAVYAISGACRDGVTDVAAKWAELEIKIQQLKVGAETELLLIDERLSSLSAMQKKVLHMYYVKGYSIVKIARILNYSEEWVKLTKNAALKKYADLKH